MRRTAALLAVTALLVGFQVAAPAAACACGGAAPPIDGGEVSVDREIAMVRWDGELEEIVMQLAMSANTGNTGLVVPTPNPATVTLADAQLFDDLVDSIEPEVIVEWDWWGSLGFGGVGGAPDGSGAPVILSQVQLGPIEATTLAADDAGRAPDLARRQRLRAARGGERPARAVRRGGLVVRRAQAHERRAVRRRARPDPVHVRVRRARVPDADERGGDARSRPCGCT